MDAASKEGSSASNALSNRLESQVELVTILSTIAFFAVLALALFGLGDILLPSRRGRREAARSARHAQEARNGFNAGRGKSGELDAKGATHPGTRGGNSK
jgi:hypothetical protein